MAHQNLTFLNLTERKWVHILNPGANYWGKVNRRMRQISHRLLAAAVYDSLSAQTLPLPLETIKINYNAVNTAMIITWSLKRITYGSSLWLRICQQDCLEAIRWPLMGHPHQANIWAYMTISTAAAVFRFKLDCLLFHFVWDCSVVWLGIWGLNYC